MRRYACQYRLPRRDEAVWIEPHWALSQHVFAVDLDHAALWERCVPVDIDGHAARRLAPRDELLMLCIHGFREQWSRLKWICDIAEIVRADPLMDWDALLRESRSVGCERILILGLLLGYDLFDAPLPRSVLAHRNRRMESLIADVSQRLFHEKSEPPTLWKPNRFRFSIRERFRDKTRYLLRTMLAPQPSLFESVHLPENLFWAYYPTRWVHDYLLLPPWLLWKQLSSG